MVLFFEDRDVVVSPFLLLLPLGFVIAVARIVRPAPRREPGQHVLTFPLPLLARARLHTVPVALMLAFALTSLAIGAAPLWVVLATIAALGGLVAWPLSYELSTAGISLGHTELRRWTEFAGVVRAPGGVRLQGSAGGRGFRIWLSGSRGDDEFVLLLRQMIKGAYQGRSARVAATDSRESDQQSDQHAMAAAGIDGG